MDPGFVTLRLGDVVAFVRGVVPSDDLLRAAADRIRRGEADILFGRRLRPSLVDRVSAATIRWLAGIPMHDGVLPVVFCRESLAQVRSSDLEGVAQELSSRGRVGHVDWDAPAPLNRRRTYARLMAAPLFVWVIFAVMWLFAHRLVWTYGSDIPYWDEWSLVPYITGDAPVTLDWLWTPHNEHRIPLPKATYLLLAGVSRGDPRWQMHLNVLLMAAACLALILATRRLRGRLSYSDAFFPLVLLHLGHMESFINSFQLQLVLSSAVVLVLLSLLANADRKNESRLAVSVALVLPMLTLTGSNGVVMIPPLACWVIWVAVRSRRNLAPILTGVVLSVALVGAYFSGLSSVAERAPSKFEDIRATATGFLSVSFGPASAHKTWVPFQFIVPVLFLVGIGMLCVAAKRDPNRRARALGLLAIFIGLAGLTLAVAWGRAEFGRGGGSADRYAVLAAPILCCMYVTWVGFGSWTDPALRIAFFSLACATLLRNEEIGLDYAKHRWERSEGFRREVKAGAPMEDLLNRYQPDLYPDKDYLRERLHMLRRAKMSLFRD